MKTLTVETKVWEGDWEYLLKTNLLNRLYKSCHYPSLSKLLYINNVNDIGAVKFYAQKLIESRIIDEFIVVNDYADEALDYFALKKEDLGVGYIYSISELVSIYLTKTDYLLHFSSDTTIPNKFNDTLWLNKLINVLEKYPNVMVSNLSWDYKFKEVRKESIFEDEDFFFGYGFSDQMYLIRTLDFQKKIYLENHHASNRYPKYGGDLFEKRIDSWMRNHNYLRATLKNVSYTHKNFPKSKLQRYIYNFYLTMFS